MFKKKVNHFLNFCTFSINLIGIYIKSNPAFSYVLSISKISIDVFVVNHDRQASNWVFVNNNALVITI